MNNEIITLEKTNNLNKFLEILRKNVSYKEKIYEIKNDFRINVHFSFKTKNEEIEGEFAMPWFISITNYKGGYEENFFPETIVKGISQLFISKFFSETIKRGESLSKGSEKDIDVESIVNSLMNGDLPSDLDYYNTKIISINC